MTTHHHLLLLVLAATTLLSFLAQGLPHPTSPTALIHLALGVGVLPLILGAMLHFTPTLTRSAPPARWINLLPLLGMAGGGVAVVAISHGLEWVLLAAPLAAGAAGGVLGWMGRRAARSLGGAHPGLAWYRASLGALLVALVAIALGVIHPEWWPAARAIHLHLNLLGFFGLAALGTLQVLLPTVGGYPDPGTPRRLRRHLWPTLGGALLVAVGSAIPLPPLAWAGGALWLATPGLLLHAAWGARPWPRPLPPLPLVGALAGMLLVGGSALLPGPHHQMGGALLPAWLAGVLFPLVSGALGHLLPLWRWPGPQAARQTAARERLLRLAPPLTALQLAAACLLLLGFPQAFHLALIALLIFGIRAAVTLVPP